MSRSVRRLLGRWLDWLALGVLISTAFCIGLIHFDVSNFASATRNIEGGALIRATFWAVLCLLCAPTVAATDALFRDPNSGQR